MSYCTHTSDIIFIPYQLNVEKGIYYFYSSGGWWFIEKVPPTMQYITCEEAWWLLGGRRCRQKIFIFSFDTICAYYNNIILSYNLFCGYFLHGISPTFVGSPPRSRSLSQTTLLFPTQKEELFKSRFLFEIRDDLLTGAHTNVGK